jgi:predicted regulator of Ras-like GTPase activity (Roadblock/LC7/MglB family)
VIGGMEGQVIITRFGEDYSLVSLISAEDNLGMAFWEIKKGIDMLQQALTTEAEG